MIFLSSSPSKPPGIQAIGLLSASAGCAKRKHFGFVCPMRCCAALVGVTDISSTFNESCISISQFKFTVANAHGKLLWIEILHPLLRCHYQCYKQKRVLLAHNGTCSRHVGKFLWPKISHTLKRLVKVGPYGTLKPSHMLQGPTEH